jgi:hypothetical protein
MSSTRGRSPRRKTVHPRDEDDGLYGRHGKLIDSVTQAIELFSREVNSSVIAHLVTDESEGRDYLKFTIEGLIPNADRFLDFIQQEGKFTNEAFFAFDQGQTVKGPVQQITLNVAKRPSSVPKKGSLAFNLVLVAICASFAALGYQFS